MNPYINDAAERIFPPAKSASYSNKAVKWADFAVSDCLKFEFLVTIRNTRPSTVLAEPFEYLLAGYFDLKA